MYTWIYNVQRNLQILSRYTYLFDALSLIRVYPWHKLSVKIDKYSLKGMNKDANVSIRPMANVTKRYNLNLPEETEAWILGNQMMAEVHMLFRYQTDLYQPISDKTPLASFLLTLYVPGWLSFGLL